MPSNLDQEGINLPTLSVIVSYFAGFKKLNDDMEWLCWLRLDVWKTERRIKTILSDTFFTPTTFSGDYPNEFGAM